MNSPLPHLDLRIGWRPELGPPNRSPSRPPTKRCCLRTRAAGSDAPSRGLGRRLAKNNPAWPRFPPILR